MAQYVTVSDVKSALVDGTIPSSQDGLISTLIERACRLIDAFTKREPDAFQAPTGIRLYDGSGKQFLLVDDMAALPTQIDIEDESIPLAQFVFEPANTFPKYKIIWNDSVFPKGKQNVAVTAKFGYSVTPPAVIQQCAVMQVIRWYKRGQQAFADVSAIPELGQLKYAQSLDPEVQAMLSHFVVRGV